MAGIGFRLQKLIRKGTLTDSLKAYLFSSMIVSGPLIISIVSLALLKLMTHNRLGIQQDFELQGIYIYATAFSLIGSAPFLYVVTRYLADQYYLKNYESFTPAYMMALVCIFIVQTPVALWFLLPLEFSPAIKLLAFCLYLMTSGMWLAMVFLSAARSYSWIVVAYGAGSATTILAGLALGYRYALTGFLGGMTLGTGLCFVLLTMRIHSEFGARLKVSAGFFLYFLKYPKLILIGVLYNLGVWIDKFVFWCSDGALVVDTVFRFHPVYDGPQLVAFLTVFPAMAYFLVQLETEFASSFHGYYKAIAVRAPFSEIERCKQRLNLTLTANFQRFILIQSVVSVVAIFFVDEIARVLEMSTLQMGVLRIAILGAYLQVTFMIIMNLLFYFDFQGEVLLLTVIYLLVNGGGSILTLYGGLTTYGLGQAVAGFVTSITGIYFLNKRVDRLEYFTFMLQPITLPRFKLESER